MLSGLLLVCFSVFYSVLSVTDNQIPALGSVEVDKQFSLCSQKCDRLAWEDATFTNYNLKDDHNESTCDNRSTARGSAQKIVSYSYYGGIRGTRPYFQGIENNAQLISKLYPGWIMRVYYDAQSHEEQEILCRLQCKYNHLDLCNAGNLPGYGNLKGSQPNIWRFLPLSDPLVDTMISRDLDSNISRRELGAVSEWLQSPTQMHIMRDHPSHGTHILAGMWGVRVSKDRTFWRQIAERILIDGKIAGHKTFDQALLTRIVWPYADKEGFTMQHDSYHCERFKDVGTMKSFPTQREENIGFNFIGSISVMTFHSNPLKAICPIACRKEAHWEHC